MNFLTILLISILLPLKSNSQETFSSRKGSKFFPGHLDIVVTVAQDTVKYELFNHWYSLSYAKLRQHSIPLDQLDAFNQKNDSLKIIFREGKVRLVDKKYRLSKNIKHRKLCASLQTMRKISYAYTLAKEHKDLNHFELYNRDDLMLDEEAFKKKISERVKELK